ncbi:Rieske (2Fe-2S) protein [Lentisalinibacter sediminis]|uniref:Rieske (2Fe-2S) protein n=1 Tax=Lentisalinibacter sediminis TaxID=2992237 RepID=UPI00386E1B23
MSPREVRKEVCRLDELADPDSRGFSVGEGDWPFRGFVVRRGDEVWAYRNYCVHAGHPLDWQPHRFLTRDGGYIICASHGAMFELDSGVCVAGPCPGKSLYRLPVEVEQGRVVVTVPDPGAHST